MFFNNKQNIEENKISFYESTDYGHKILDLKDSMFDKVKSITMEIYPDDYIDFTCFPNLEKIYINCCKTETFELKHSNIISLRIHQGEINTINIDTPSLESITIQNNLIEKITYENLKSKNLTSIDFNSNILKVFNLNINFAKCLKLHNNLLSDLSIN